MWPAMLTNYQSRVFFSLVELVLNVSMVTTRLRLVRDRMHNSTLLLQRPIRELQSLPNGETTTVWCCSLNNRWSDVLMYFPVFVRFIHAAAAGSGSDLSSTFRAAWCAEAAAETPRAIARFFLCGGKHKQDSEGDQPADDSYSVCRSVNQQRNGNVIQSQDMQKDQPLFFFSANEAQRKLKEVEDRAQHLMEKIKPLSMLGEMLSKNLSDIRELIDQARRQAASVRKRITGHNWVF